LTYDPNEGGPSEYFLIENRQRSGGYYDRNIPGEGLLIWHITMGRSNTDEARKLIDLECADGRFIDAGFPAGRISDPVNGGDNLDFWSRDETYRSVRNGNLLSETSSLGRESSSPSFPGR
jgi:hypothetical protein